MGAESCSILVQGEGRSPGGDEAGSNRRGKKQKLGKIAFNTKKAKAQGKGGTDKERRPSGPDLPREVVNFGPVLGTVIAWKGKFGWIKPSDPIELPEEQKHSGKIYVPWLSILIDFREI